MAKAKRPCLIFRVQMVSLKSKDNQWLSFSTHHLFAGLSLTERKLVVILIPVFALKKRICLTQTEQTIIKVEIWYVMPTSIQLPETPLP